MDQGNSAGSRTAEKVTPASQYAAERRERERLHPEFIAREFFGRSPDAAFRTIAELRKRIDRLEAEMNEVRNELEEDFDITESGGPNKAMRLANMIDEALYGPGGC